MSIIVRRPVSVDEFEQYFDLRYRILRQPMGQPKGSEMNENLIYEYGSHHLIAFDTAAKKIVGGVMGYIEKGCARIRYLCVEEEYRKRGIGRQLMDRIEHKLVKFGASKCILYARETVVDFYSKRGYTIVKRFNVEEALKDLGIALAHALMEKPMAFAKL